MGLTVADIRERLRAADQQEFDVLERSLVADTRKGVRAAVEVARKRLQAEVAEQQRLASLYGFDAAQACGGVLVGLDEVGRGPLAGPLAVGAVVLPPQPRIAGLNDSKQVKPELRQAIAQQVRQQALACTVQYVEPQDIDRQGMTASLKQAFAQAVAAIEQQGFLVDVVLLDGNPLHFDPREVNVVKGDAKSASIAAASIIAKVERDQFMCRQAELYPAYGFDSNKGYGCESHIQAIRQQGLCPLHRRSFCTSFTQDTLF